jgi:hypothetical protein
MRTDRRIQRRTGGNAGLANIAALNIACAGSLSARREQWCSWLEPMTRLPAGMEQLYDLFTQADVLGSLINPQNLGEAFSSAGSTDSSR